MAPRVVAVVQARLGSTRLWGKVALRPIAGRPMLELVLARARAIPGVDQTVLATTENREDDRLVETARSLNVPSVRGSVDDVLDRFRVALQAYPADAIVRITADCPLLDPTVSGRVVAEYLAHRDDTDYVSNVEPPTYPDGLDTEVVAAAALERAWHEATLPSDREHVTTYIRARKALFRVRNVTHDKDLSWHRWTVDEPRDLDFVRAIYAAIEPEKGPLFGMEHVLDLLNRHPELSRLNEGIQRNEGLERSRQRDATAPATHPSPATEAR